MYVTALQSSYRIFLSFQKVPSTASQSIPSLTQGNIALNSIPIAYCVCSSISYKWNLTLHIDLCLASFVSENIFEIHPC